MNIVGIIAEYNPFHNGHLYQLSNVRKVLKPDGIIVIMSGNFVQRGEPAVFSKWARAEMALREGADLVIELPVCFSTATAEIFAESAVKLLLQSQVVNTLSFGIERYCEKELFYLGKLLSEEPDLFKQFMNDYLKKGLSFPAAREKAVIKYIMVKNINLDTQLISDLLKKPNYILAVEYVKAINKLKAEFSIFPVLRQGHDYHDKELTQQYASASAIRQELFYRRQDFSNELVKNLPDSALQIIKKEIEDGRTPVFLQDFETILLYALRCMSAYELKTYFDVAEGLENRIKKAAQACGTLEQLISQIKSKRYPVTRIQRILMHILLNIPKEIVEIRTPQYLRVLGFTRKGALILKKMNSKATVPVITRASEYKNLNQSAKIMFEKDLLSSDVYSLAYKNAALRNGGSDFRRSVIYFNSFK
ncbi:nucleotidyltransferase [Tepidanaerobacter sp. EBM-38]|uniref:nucleotidyltransferase n=1 Tax=Tepidanaerobacter sp. EBM-38 TaxID=1918496 RepID=UPI000A9A9AB1|nr:nucleotidyltransferase [Tepidanaerobacter sp. EBM-38]